MPLIVTPGTLFRRANFYLQLSGMLTGGIPIIQSLETLKRTSRSYTKQLSQSIYRLQMGSTLTEAFQSCGRWLPEFDITLISAGETSGRLDSTLRLLGNYYTDQAKTLRGIVFSMIYPFFLIHFALLVFPTKYLTALFQPNGIQNLIQQKFTTFLTLWVAFFCVLAIFNAPFGRPWRSLLAAVANAVPVLGGARRSYAISKFAAALESLISAGVSIIEAWRLAGQASGSARIRKAVQWAIPHIQAGMTPAEAIQQLSVFPEAFRTAYATGEVSGQLDTALTRMHDLFWEEAKLKFQNFGRAAPVVIFLFVALGIGYQVVTFWMDYYGQIDKIM